MSEHGCGTAVLHVAEGAERVCLESNLHTEGREAGDLSGEGERETMKLRKERPLLPPSLPPSFLLSGPGPIGARTSSSKAERAEERRGNGNGGFESQTGSKDLVRLKFALQ